MRSSTPRHCGCLGQFRIPKKNEVEQSPESHSESTKDSCILCHSLCSKLVSSKKTRTMTTPQTVCGMVDFEEVSTPHGDTQGKKLILEAGKKSPFFSTPCTTKMFGRAVSQPVGPEDLFDEDMPTSSKRKTFTNMRYVFKTLLSFCVYTKSQDHNHQAFYFNGFLRYKIRMSTYS